MMFQNNATAAQYRLVGLAGATSPAAAPRRESATRYERKKRCVRKQVAGGAAW